MPLFDFQCAAGHIFEDFLAVKKDYPREVPCVTPGCKLAAKRLVSMPGPPSGALEKNDIPAHFNGAFGTVVKGRKHMKELQRKHGTQDWRPVKGQEPVKDMLKRTGKAGRYGVPA